MIGPLFMGLVAGARSQTPLAAVAWLARTGGLPNEGPLGGFLSRDGVLAGAALLALGELVGDKMRTAPDRIVAPGLAARLVTGAVAGAALVRRRDQAPAAFIGAAAAVGGAYLTFAMRHRAMARLGQRPTGVAEDVVVIASALCIACAARRADVKS